MKKCPRLYPDNSALPEYHYLAYDKTPLGEREIDDWQPRTQIIKQFAEKKLSSSDPESISVFGDKYIVKTKLVLEYVKHLEVKEWKKEKKRNKTEENVKRAKEKMYSDYKWDNLVKDDKELKKLRVCELNKYLVHNGLHKYLKIRKPDKIHILQQHWFSKHAEMEEESDIDVHAEEEDNDIRREGECDEEHDDDDDDDEDDEEEEDSMDIEHDIVLAVIAEEDYWETREAVSRSGRKVHKRNDTNYLYL